MATNTPSEVPVGVPPAYYPPTQPPRNRALPWIIGLIIGAILLPVAVCAILVATVGSLASLWTRSQVPATATYSQTFSVTENPAVTIHNMAGQVTIVAGGQGQVVVQATRRASDVSSDMARHALESVTVAATQSGNTVTVEGKVSSNHPLTQQRVDMVVTVPSLATTNVTISAGTLKISDLTGTVNATVSAGDVTLSNVTIVGVSVITAHAGRLAFAGALDRGSTLTVQTDVGSVSVRLPQETATYLDAATKVGDITVSGWPMTIKREGAGATTSGYTKLNTTSTLIVRVTTGAIDIAPR